MNVLVGCGIAMDSAEMKPCKRGSIAPRSKHGHCQCEACKAFRSKRSMELRPIGYHAEWQKKNKDKTAAYQKKWVADNKAKRRAIETAWQKNNPQKRAEINARAGKKWAANNRAARDASVRSRKLAQIMRTPKWADFGAIKKVYELAKKISRESGIPYEVDHVVPLQGEMVSGLHVHNNLQIIPRSVNRSKRNKWNSES